MLFAVDVGNSHTVSGIFDKGKLVGNWRMQSRQDRTADELAIRYHGLFQMAGIDPGRITGFIVASVVPVLETSWLHFARSYLTHLRQPPRGYAWSRVGDDYLLAALATGIIFDIINN